jgi:ABC-type polysaccharide/polyol phosphate export permease
MKRLTMAVQMTYVWLHILVPPSLAFAIALAIGMLVYRMFTNTLGCS